jgi:hypothetical protein
MAWSSTGQVQGNVSPEDAHENALSLRQGFRLVSSYPVGDDPAARV